MPVRRAAPWLVPVEPGIALAGAEVVLTRDARPGTDPTLLLRAAAVAAERDVELAPVTAARLVAEIADLPDPWPAAARQALVRLLAAGPGLLPVWETLEETGALSTFLPEWERIRLLPHASEIHRFTVDRHVVETCMEAAALIRQVSRPDVLLIAALLHDIGKGGLTEHSIAGEPLARDIATRMGFDESAVALVGLLVRQHLLLAETATTRDPEDPATVELVTKHIRDREELELLFALTEADAKATSEKAWTTWRAQLVRSLVRRSAAELSDADLPDSLAPESIRHEVEIPKRVRKDPREVAVTVEESADGSVVTVVSGDRVGLLADAAGMLALHKISVRAARVWNLDDYGVSVWHVATTGLDAAVLRERLEAVVEGRVDLARRLRPTDASALAPTVVVRPEASQRATVLEVRAANRPGVVHVVCAALAHMGLTVTSAHVDTLGPQAVDVFYVQESQAGALTDRRAADAAHAVRAALSGTEAGSSG